MAEVLLQKTWTIYRCSALLDFHVELLDIYGIVLKTHLEAAISHADAAVDPNVIVELRSVTLEDNLNMVVVNILNSRALLLLWPTQQLLFSRGNSGLCTHSLEWLRLRFDTHFAHVSLPPFQLQSMLVPLLQLENTNAKRTRKSLELTFQFPSYITSIETVTLNFPWTEVSAMLDAGPELLSKIKRHFKHHFSIELNHLTLIRMGTNNAFLSVDGRLKVFDTPVKVIKLLIQALGTT